MSSLAELRNQVELNMARFPNHDPDLIGAVEALFRLQLTYNLTTKTMAKGRIPGQGGHYRGGGGGGGGNTYLGRWKGVSSYRAGNSNNF